MGTTAIGDADTVHVSAVIPTYNRADLLREALDSVLHQTRPPDRVIVVNDGSTDETEQVLSHYGSGVEVFRQSNLGKSKALNRAVRDISDGWIWLFDDDDVAYKDAVEANLSTLAQHPTASFTYSARTDLFCARDGRILDCKTVDLPAFPDDQILPALLENCFFHLQGSLIHASCFETLTFREDLYRAMDYEFMIRLARHFAGARVDQPTYYLRRHAGPRGPASTRFNIGQVGHHWHVNERLFFADLYQQFDLAEYLGAHCRSAACGNPGAHARALVTRATVMARKGLWQLAIADLETVASSPAALATVTDTERRQLQRLTERDHPLFELLDDASLVRRLRRVLNTACGSVDRLKITREMYFTLARSKNRPNFVRTLMRSSRLLYLLGWRGTIQYTRTKLSKLEQLTFRRPPDAR